MRNATVYELRGKPCPLLRVDKAGECDELVDAVFRQHPAHQQYPVDPRYQRGRQSRAFGRHHDFALVGDGAEYGSPRITDDLAPGRTGYYNGRATRDEARASLAR